MIRVKREPCFALGWPGDRAAVGDCEPADLRLEIKFHPRRGQGALEQVGHFEIETDRDPREKFEDGDFGTEPAPDRAELEPDSAGGADEEVDRRRCERRGTGEADEGGEGEGQAREREGDGPGRAKEERGRETGGGANGRQEQRGAGTREGGCDVGWVLVFCRECASTGLATSADESLVVMPS